MKIFTLIFVLHFFALFSVAFSAPASECRTCPPALQLAFRDLYAATGGAAAWPTWNVTRRDCFALDGVSVTCKDGLRALSVWPPDLADGSLAPLQGTIPEHVWTNLTFYSPAGLIFSAVNYPMLSGVLPDSLFETLPPGSRVALSGSSVSGTVPAAAFALNRVRLEFDRTRIGGWLPANLTAYQFTGSTLSLEQTLVSGVLPSSLFFISNAAGVDKGRLRTSTVDLGRTRISGVLPDLADEGGDSVLSPPLLNLAGTQLSGTLPDFVTRLPVKSAVRVSGTRVSGELPERIGESRGELTLDSTLVSGTLPASVADLWCILSLQKTAVAGTLPRVLTLHDGSLFLRGTAVSGSMPETVHVVGTSRSADTYTLDVASTDVCGPLTGNWTVRGVQNPLLTLDITGTRVSGTLSPSLSSMGGGLELYASGSGLHGIIPAELGSMLRILFAPATRLSGPLPPEMPMCEMLQLGSTAIAGSLPELIGDSIRAVTVVLQGTNMAGTLPVAFMRGDVASMRLADSGLYGEVPWTRVSNSYALYDADLSDNDLEGVLPDTLGDHYELRSLDVSGNAGLVGTVPEGLDNLISLNVARTGLVVHPYVLSGFRLRMLNLAYTPIELTDAFCEDLSRTSSHSPVPPIQALDLSGVDSRVKLGWITECVLKDTRLAVLRLAHMPLVRERLTTSTQVGAVDIVHASDTLQELDLTDTGIVQLRASLGDGVAQAFTNDEFNSAALPALERLVLNDNPGLNGAMPDSFSQLRELAISRTNYDVCASLSIFRSRLLRRIELLGIPVPYERCKALVTQGFIRAVDGEETTDTALNYLRCPQWELTSVNRSVLVTDSSFLDWYGCRCPDNWYFGRSPDRNRDTTQSWASMRASLPGELSCFTCPPGGKVECASSADPREESAPRHWLRGSSYPLYRTPQGTYEYRSERWRLVYAELIDCQHPNICGDSEASARSSAHVTCREGHEPTTMLCSRCAEHFYMVGLLCYRCPSSASWLVPCLMVLAVVLFVAFVNAKNFAKPGITFTSWFFWLQLDDVLTGVNQRLRGGQYEETVNPVHEALRKMAMFNPFAMECTSPDLDFGPMSVLIFASPAMVAVGVVLLFLLVQWLSPRLGTAPLRELWSQQPKWETSLLYTWNILLFPLMFRIFQVFVCDSEPRVDAHFLRAAPWISCGSRQHVALVVLGVLVLLGFVVPLTVYFWVQLSRRAQSGTVMPDSWRPSTSVNAGALTSDAGDVYELMTHDHDSEDGLTGRSDSVADAVDAPTVFLTASVRDKFWFWPVAVQHVRSLLIALLVDVVSPRSIYLPMCVFLVLQASLLVHLVFRPYKRTVDNAMEALVLVGAIVRYMLSMLAGLDSVASSAGVHELSFGLNVVVFCAVLWVLSAKFRRRCFKEVARRLELDSRPNEP